jgi:hypothetical protein
LPVAGSTIDVLISPHSASAPPSSACNSGDSSGSALVAVPGSGAAEAEAASFLRAFFEDLLFGIVELVGRTLMRYHSLSKKQHQNWTYSTM